MAFIKERFGIEMDRAMFSSYKSQEKARAGKKARGQEGHGRREAAEAPALAPSTDGTDVVLALEAIKTLCDQLGVDQVKRIAEILRK